ncbi:MAG: membrane protein [Bacteroidetes bacterium OLB11]|nr:MAG: membrane protein [Bacteroidetes bacterium OLB11]
MIQHDFFFNDIKAIEVLDILLVLLIVFQLFRSLKGSRAFNIFIGALIVYISWLIVKKLQMPFMSEILDRLVSIGLIGLLVVFQPEVRKFLIVLGRRSSIGKNSFITKFLNYKSLNKYILEEDVIEEITIAIRYLQEKKLGAILVITLSNSFGFDTNTGHQINGTLSAKLLETIFSKSTPLHDGAVVIEKNMIISAGVVLPLSQNTELPSNIGLRHRSAVGASETSDVLVVVVSEETSKLSIAFDGKLQMNVPLEDVKKQLF